MQSEIQLQRLTSGHNVADILHSQSRVLVLRVDPDDAVAQPTHGQDGSGWEWSSTGARSTEKTGIKK